MTPTRKQVIGSALWIGGLIALTCAAMAYSGGSDGPRPGGQGNISAADGRVSLSGRLTQDKVMVGGDGRFSLALTLAAARSDDRGPGDAKPVDMVIVIDRSGSMAGEKLSHARSAVEQVVAGMSGADRCALVSYSDNVRVDAPLTPADAAGRELITSAVSTVRAGGATNLGAGLETGLRVLRGASRAGATGRMILISDGLANRGVTDPAALGRMAAAATEADFSISTAGVGDDFNEVLLTAIADRGTGTYHYIENPTAFASVFKDELHFSRAVVASTVAVRVPLGDGVILEEAAGYPIRMEGNEAVFHPGDLKAGDRRRLFLSFRVPADRGGQFTVRGVRVTYRTGDRDLTVALTDAFTVACVADERAVFSSIDSGAWGRKVVQDDFNRLKDRVAGFLREGDKEQAVRQIEEYEQAQGAVNAEVRSQAVDENLKQDVKALRDVVRETFDASPPESARLRKQNAKALQYDGYKGRRAADGAK